MMYKTAKTEVEIKTIMGVVLKYMIAATYKAEIAESMR